VTSTTVIINGDDVGNCAMDWQRRQ